MHFKFEISDLRWKKRQRPDIETFGGGSGANFCWRYIGGRSERRPYAVKRFSGDARTRDFAAF
jgi:hypothetical protein